MNRSLKCSMFAVLLISTIALAVPGGQCGMLAGCHTRPNYTRCIACCDGAGCQSAECRAFCYNTFRRFKPGTPNVPATVVS